MRRPDRRDKGRQGEGTHLVRFPPRLRVISSGGIALDALLSAGTIDDRQHAAGLTYARLRQRFDRSGGAMRSWRDRSGLSDDAWQAVKRDHAALIRAAGAERFMLDRLCLDGDAPLRSEVERVRAALGRVAGAERFMLDRLCLDGDAPLRSEVERVRAALGRVAAGVNAM